MKILWWKSHGYHGAVRICTASDSSKCFFSKNPQNLGPFQPWNASWKFQNQGFWFLNQEILPFFLFLILFGSKKDSNPPAEVCGKSWFAQRTKKQRKQGKIKFQGRNLGNSRFLESSPPDLDKKQGPPPCQIFGLNSPFAGLLGRFYLEKGHILSFSPQKHLILGYFGPFHLISSNIWGFSFNLRPLLLNLLHFIRRSPKKDDFKKNQFTINPSFLFQISHIYRCKSLSDLFY